MSTELVLSDGTTAMPVASVKHQIQLIQELMKSVMQQGEHYGTIPGCGPKPALLKPGAEKLCFTFRLAPRFEVVRRDLPHEHVEYEIITSLYSVQTEKFVGSGVGLCSTMEKKYRYTSGKRLCPKCNKESIIKGKSEYGGGWVCFAKKGGCGAKFSDGDQSIEGQSTGNVENDNPSDFLNTVLKMAKKRSLVDAVLTATAASDIFTQDIDESIEPTNDMPDDRRPIHDAPVEQKKQPPKESFPNTILLDKNNNVVKNDGELVAEAKKSEYSEQYELWMDWCQGHANTYHDVWADGAAVENFAKPTIRKIIGTNRPKVYGCNDAKLWREVKNAVEFETGERMSRLPVTA